MYRLRELDFLGPFLLLFVNSFQVLSPFGNGWLRELPAGTQFFQGLRLLELTFEALERLVNRLAVFDFYNQHKLIKWTLNAEVPDFTGCFRNSGFDWFLKFSNGAQI
jgi:hypothetical protein